MPRWRSPASCPISKALMDRQAVLAAPLRSGGGVRNKVIEAMAAGLARGNVPSGGRRVGRALRAGVADCRWARQEAARQLVRVLQDAELQQTSRRGRPRAGRAGARQRGAGATLGRRACRRRGRARMTSWLRALPGSALDAFRARVTPEDFAGRVCSQGSDLWAGNGSLVARRFFPAAEIIESPPTLRALRRARPGGRGDRDARWRRRSAAARPASAARRTCCSCLRRNTSIGWDSDTDPARWRGRS